MITEKYSFTHTDTAFSSEKTVYFPAEGQAKMLNAGEYSLKNAYVLVFDASGKLYEGGYNLQAYDGSVQHSVYVPAGGFALAFSSESPLYSLYLTATEGAFIPCCTVSLIYPMIADVDTEGMCVTVSYEESNVKEGADKILFVGNSCTYINGVPLKFKAMCRAAGIETDVDYCTFGNAYFYEYTDECHPRGQALRNKLASKKYDYIVLQDGSDCPLDVRTEHTERLLKMVEENGAKPVFNMRYGYGKDIDDRLTKCSDMYGTFAMYGDIYGVPVAPVASAFIHTLLWHENINLYADDNSHHSKEGSYLAAGCLLDTIYGISPVGNEYTAGFDGETALELQQLSFDACEAERESARLALEYEAEQELKKFFKKKKKKERKAEKKKALMGFAALAAVTAAAIIAVKVLNKKK